MNNKISRKKISKKMIAAFLIASLTLQPLFSVFADEVEQEPAPDAVTVVEDATNEDNGLVLNASAVESSVEVVEPKQEPVVEQTANAVPDPAGDDALVDAGQPVQLNQATADGDTALAADAGQYAMLAQTMLTNANEDEDEDDGPTVVYHTVTYMVDGSVYKQEQVEEDTLPDLTAPNVTEALPFLGWYADGESAPFGDSRPVTEDITLTAKFSLNYLVTFLDTTGRKLDVVEVEPGDTVSPTSSAVTVASGKEFSHWALEGTTTPYTFSTPVNANITLVPVIGSLSMAVFVTQSTEIEPQSGISGFLATPPKTAPTRTGYTFGGWYADKACTIPFDFTKGIEGTTFIYAKWDPATSNYTVNYMVEKVDITGGDPRVNAAAVNDYELTYSKSFTGTTDATVTLTEAEANAGRAGAIGDALTLFTFSEFFCSEEKEISPTGDTVINVYYTRMRFTFNFDVNYEHKSADTYNTSAATFLVGSIYTRDGVNHGSTYSITVTYGQTVTDIWPFKVEVKNKAEVELKGYDNATTRYFLNWGGYYGNGSEVVPQSAIVVGFCNTPALQHLYVLKDPVRTSVNLYPKTDTTGNINQRYYFVEITSDQYIAGGGADNPELRFWTPIAGTDRTPRYYKLAYVGAPEVQRSNPMTAATGWPGRDIAGYETIGTTGTYSTKYFQKVFDLGGSSYRTEYYMPVKSYTLTFNLNGGTVTDTTGLKKDGNNYIRTAPVQYLTPLGNLLIEPSNIQYTGHDFAGWYTDEALTIPYKSGDTMPAGNTSLYAKYVGTEVEVVYTDGSQTIKTSGYSFGESLNKHDLAETAYSNIKVGDVVGGKGIFEGWYYTIGTTNKAELEFPLGLPLTQSRYVLTAKFTPLTYTVTFMADEADGNYLQTAQQSVQSGANNTLALAGHRPVTRQLTGYTFLGWSTAQNSRFVNFSTATRITEDVTVYAVWRVIDYTLSFNMNGATSAQIPDVTSIHYNDDLADHKPSDPTRTGYNFLFWTLNGVRFDWSTARMPASNMTLTAQWEVIPELPVTPSAEDTFTLIFDVNGGTSAAPAPQTLNVGAAATPVSNPSRPGYTFTGWSYSTNGGTYWNVRTFTMPASNVTVYAQWQSNTVPSNPDTPNIAPNNPGKGEPLASPEVISIGETEVPLMGFANCWALVNLILVIVGVLLSLASLIRHYTRRDDEELSDEENNRNRKRSLNAKLIASLFAILGIIVFFLTEDMTLKMALVDKWTLLMAVLFLLQPIALWFGKRETPDSQEPEAATV